MLDQAQRATLREIGLKLDSGAFPRVLNGGVVVPGDRPAALRSPGTEKTSGQEPSRRSEAGSRQRPAGRQGPPGRPGQAREAAPLARAGTPSPSSDELRELEGAYPGAQVWQRDDGYWLCVSSHLLPRLEPSVNFLVYVLATSGTPLLARGWAFWANGIWVGPRHTNWDGSICAFADADRAWVPNDSIVNLLDLYTTWAVRHLHLSEFGRWPGPQLAATPAERILEQHPTELCGCGRSSTAKYSECCSSKDISESRIGATLKWMTLGRHPPREIEEIVLKNRVPPSVAEGIALSYRPNPFLGSACCRAIARK